MARSSRLMLGTSLIGLALACCGSPPEAEVRQRDVAVCASRGFQPGTPDFAACLQQQPAATRCLSGPLAALHIKPHPQPLSCGSDPA